MHFLPYAVFAAACVFAPASARADTGPCRGGALAVIQPADGQTDVPLDVHPRVLIDELKEDTDCYAGYSEATLTLKQDDSDIATTQVNADGWMQIRELVPASPLEPNTKYTFVIGSGETAKEISFTTGSRSATALVGTPTLEILEAREDRSQDWHDGRALHQLSFRITPSQADPDGLSLVRLTSEAWDHAVFAVGPADPITSEVHHWGAEGQPICMTVAHVSANGSEVGSEEVCVEPEPAAGCHAGRGARGSGVWIVAVVMGAMLLRRRAR